MKLRTEFGGLALFAGGGKAVLTLKFQSLAIVQYGFILPQSSKPTTSLGHYRQRGSSLGVLALLI